MKIGCAHCDWTVWIDPGTCEDSPVALTLLHQINRHPRRYLRRHPQVSHTLRGWAQPWPRWSKC